jgi:catechol 2,3-dioxygenase-like lactoylglutathione lyase family enzyme
MTAQLDHLILAVSDPKVSTAFYAQILGFPHVADQGPFAVVRVNEAVTLQLVQAPTSGGEHLAFAMSRAEFDGAFARIRESGIGYGDVFNTVGSQRGPGNEEGSRGFGDTVYFFDPDRHLLEIRHYER